MKYILKSLLFASINVVLIYLLSLIIKSEVAAFIILLAIVPLLCFVISLIYGVLFSFNVLYPIFLMLLLWPTIHFLFNESANIYIIAYGVIALLGNIVGYLIYRKNN